MNRTNTILEGSALQRLRELDNDFVDSCITSPLYWSTVAKSKTEPQVWDAIEYPNGNQTFPKWEGELGLEPSETMYIGHLMMVFDEVRRVLKPEGSCCVVIGDTYKKKCLSMVPEKFALAMIDHGWILRSKIIWYKSNHIPSKAALDRFDIDWESIYWFTKNRQYYFEKRCEGLPSYLQDKNSSVLLIPTEEKPTHFKFPVFPRDLIRILMCKTSPKGGMILDPFLGSGTTAIVALETGRRYLGIEVSRDFIRLATRRIKGQN